MKKNYFFLVLLSLSLSVLRAQNVFELTNQTNGGSAVNDNDVFYRATTASGTIEHDFDIKNISSLTQTFSVTKTDVQLNTVITGSDVAEAYFCTGLNCYGSDVFTATFTLAAGASMTIRTDLHEASSPGQSEISYKIADTKKNGQALTLYMKYNNPLSVRSNETIFSNVSNVYPNPCSGKAFMTVSSPVEMNGVTLSVINSLGSVVYTKPLNINSGKNTISIESESLSSGLYFVSISSGSSVITKKITIVK